MSTEYKYYWVGKENRFLPVVTNEVGGNNIILGVPQNSLQLALRFLPGVPIKRCKLMSTKELHRVEIYPRFEKVMVAYLIAALIWS